MEWLDSYGFFKKICKQRLLWVNIGYLWLGISSKFRWKKFQKIYNLFKNLGFSFVDDIVLKYIEIFELPEEEVLDKIETLKNTLGDNYKNIISNNMNILKYLV